MVTTEIGLERITLKDLKEHFNIDGQLKGLRGKIFFYNYDIRKIIELNFSARSINRVILLLKHEKIRTLRDIVDIAKEVAWAQYFDNRQTFGVNAERIGKHDFSSLDVARELGNIIMKELNAEKKKVKVNLKAPDVKIVAEIINNDFILGIDTTGPSLHMRRYRVYNHPSPLRTTLAYLLIRIANWKKSETLLDPMCGGGTIPIEAALYGRNIPILLFRREEYALYKLSFIDKDIIEKVKATAVKQAKKSEKLKIFGLDINKRHINGAIKNATSAKVIDTIKFLNENIENLNSIFKPNSFDVVVTDPPYKLKFKGRMRGLYETLLKNVFSLLRQGGHCVIITSAARLFESIANKLNVKYEKLKMRRDSKLPTAIYTIRKD